tara:strand:- start:3128 stop:3862 length:735 start_codon:yes stop_codon:yes gene_type:complete
MTVRFDFNWIEETHKIIDDEFQVTVTVGNKGDIQSRDTFEEGLLYFSETTAEIKEHILDEESSHIVYRPNHFILIQGRIQSCQRWSEEDGIEAKDIERLKEITKDDKIKKGEYTESTTEDAIANREFLTNYKFGADFDEAYPRSAMWHLNGRFASQTAMEDDTRFLCFMTEKPGYNLKLLDIEPGKTKTLLKENNVNHVFFSQACSLNQQSIYVDQYDVKKLTSPSIDITNESSEVARIVSITK